MHAAIVLLTSWPSLRCRRDSRKTLEILQGNIHIYVLAMSYRVTHTKCESWPRSHSCYCGKHCVPFLKLILLFSYHQFLCLSISYDAIPYQLWSAFSSILSLASVVVQFMALHYTDTHQPVLILVVCFTYLVAIFHNVLFHMTCVYSLPK